MSAKYNGLALFGAFVSALTFIGLVSRTFDIGLQPLVDDFVRWWHAFTAPLMSVLYVPLKFLLPDLIVPQWVRELHVLSVIGATMFVQLSAEYRYPWRERLESQVARLSLVPGVARSNAINVVAALVLGLVGLGLMYLLAGIALVFRPRVYGLRYVFLVKEPEVRSDMLHLFRSTAITFGIVFVAFLSNGVQPS